MPRAASRAGTGVTPTRAKPDLARSPTAAPEILAAAQRCFVRSGFHGASMQDICAEAGMSPGNLYRYFPSKEALIAGIAERDRAEVAQEFASADLSHGFFAVLEGMAHHHFAERPDEQVKLCTEVMSEARRNPEIARISAGVRRRRAQMALSTCSAPAPSAATFPGTSISTPLGHAC